MRDEIKFVGINAQLNDYECKDGELYATDGLWMDEVSLQGLALPAVQFSVGAGLRLMGVHETSAFRHWLLVGEDSMSGDVGWYLYWVDSDVTGEVTKEALTAAGQRVSIGREEIRRVGTIGNVVLCMTDSGIHYVLWKSDLERDGSGEGGVVCVHEGAYKDLGTHLPEVPISFGLRGEMVSYVPKDGTEWESYKIPTDEDGKIKEGYKVAAESYVKGLLNKLIVDEATNKGRFMMPFLVRYAYRLYDGSVTMHSAPVLMKPSTKACPALMRKGNDDDVDDKKLLAIGMACRLDYHAYEQSAVLALKEWGDIVTGVDIFITPPIYIYDQAGEVESIAATPRSQKLLGHWIGRLEVPGTETPDDDVKYKKRSADDMIAGYLAQLGINDARGVDVPRKSDEAVTGNIRTAGDFYLLKSLTIEDLLLSNDEITQDNVRRVVPVADDYLQSLLQRERLDDDFGSHDQLAADVSYSYNNRLNLAGLRRQRFEGFTTASMLPFTNALGQILEYDEYAGTKYRLGTQRGAMTVTPDHFGVLVARKEVLQGAYLFYPSPECNQVTMNHFPKVAPNREIHLPMRPHEMLHGAVWFDGLDSTLPDEVEGTTAVSPDRWEPMEDKIYTSAINNPFTFPLSGINTIPGGGKVIGIASATKALSQGQFGQFPLYAFTTYGVWALEVNGQTAGYSARQPIGRDVCVDGDSITQTDDAVLFVTDRGLMMVSSSKISCLSDKIKGGTVPLDGEADGAQVDVLSYLRGCSMVYDYIGQRVLLFNPDYDYNLVYSMRSGEWGGGALGVTGKVDCWPASAVITAGGVEGRADVRMTDGGQDPDAWLVDGWLVTRPLKLRAGGDVLKTVRSVIVRGVFREGHVQVELEGSRDLFMWHRIWSSATHRVRGYSGTPWKYFRLRLYVSLERDESLTGASVDYVVKYLGKMR